MLTESNVFTLAIKYLEENGYNNIIKKADIIQHGIDVSARSPTGRLLLIEAEGETSSKMGSKLHGREFTSSQKENHFGERLVEVDSISFQTPE
jgi:hypothetical protein